MISCSLKVNSNVLIISFYLFYVTQKFCIYYTIPENVLKIAEHFPFQYNENILLFGPINS
jgi:hypothetical protein